MLFQKPSFTQGKVVLVWLDWVKCQSLVFVFPKLLIAGDVLYLQCLGVCVWKEDCAA